MAQKAGLSLADVDDWTPGMLFDMIAYKLNAIETAKEPKPPDQAVFDNF